MQKKSKKQKSRLGDQQRKKSVKEETVEIDVRSRKGPFEGRMDNKQNSSTCQCDKNAPEERSPEITLRDLFPEQKYCCQNE